MGGATGLRKLWEEEEQRRDATETPELPDKPEDAEDNYAAALSKGTEPHG